jgi:N-acetylmuramoyl-L-alanine amidase CwlA
MDGVISIYAPMIGFTGPPWGALSDALVPHYRWPDGYCRCRWRDDWSAVALIRPQKKGYRETPFSRQRATSRSEHIIYNHVPKP